MGTYQITVTDTYSMATIGTNLYSGGTLIQSNGVTVATDRLGSVRSNANGEKFAYYPYGVERTTPLTPDGREKFGTYFRDLTLNGVPQDYADQRYYNGNIGSFWSPDPGGLATANPKNPTSWNRYLYANGDPVNFRDPSGKSVLSAIWGFLTGGDDEPLPDVGSDPDDDDPYPCGGDYFNPAPNPACYASDGGVPDQPVDNTDDGDSGPECPLVGITGSYTLVPSWPVYAEFAPDMSADVDQAIATLNSESIVPQINSGYRGTKSQGNIPKNNPYPHAKPGKSWHNVGLAIDIQLTVGTNTANAIIAAFESAGLTWGGTFTKADNVHFQLPGAKSTNGIITSGAPSAAQVAACEAEHPNGH